MAPKSTGFEDKTFILGSMTLLKEKVDEIPRFFTSHAKKLNKSRKDVDKYILCNNQNENANGITIDLLREP